MNNHQYIGSSKNIHNRWQGHLYNLRKGNYGSSHFQLAFNKYGEQTFELQILEECLLEDLLIREQWYFDTYNPEYNSSTIAGAITFTTEVRKAISQAQIELCQNPKERKRRSERLKQQWASGIMVHTTALAQVGVERARQERIALGLNPSFLTTEQYKIIGDKNKGRKNTPESCAQMSESHKGVPWSEIQREGQIKAWTPERRQAASDRAKLHGLGRRIKAGGKSKERYQGT